MKIAKVFLIFLAVVFSFASLGFYLYILFTPLWDLSLRMIPLYLYPARMFLILAILLIILTVVMSKKKFDDNLITRVCIGACAVMVCMGIGTSVCAHKEYKDFTFIGLGKVDFESEREKYVPYNHLFEMDGSLESNYAIQQKGNNLVEYVYADNYFSVATDRDLVYGAELFRSDSELLKFKFNMEKINPFFDEPIHNALVAVGESGERNSIEYVLFANEDDYAVKISEHEDIFYIYLINTEKYGVTADDFLNVAIEQYGLFSNLVDKSASLSEID